MAVTIEVDGKPIKIDKAEWESYLAFKRAREAQKARGIADRALLKAIKAKDEAALKAFLGK